AVTVKTMITSRAVLLVLLLTATAGLLSQAVFEFGPLWLVALAAPAVVSGRVGGAGGRVRAVLGGAGLHPWRRRPADRQAAPGALADGRGADHRFTGHSAGADLDPLPAGGDSCTSGAGLGLGVAGNPR